MPKLIKISVPEDTQIVVAGDIHGQLNHFKRFVSLVDPSLKSWLVSAGDIFDKGQGREAEYTIINSIRKLNERGIGYIVNGNHELKYLRRADKNNSWTPELKWLATQPYGITFTWPNGRMCTVVHGGILPKHTWENLATDDDVCYVRDIDENGEYIPLIWVTNKVTKEKELIKKKNGHSWHEVYDGRFGYVIAGHAQQMDGMAKFYSFSANLDSGCYNSGILTAQVYNQNGLGDTWRIRI